MPGSDVTVPDNTGWKLTYDDLVELPEDRLRHELIDGEHYVTPAPSLRHQTIVLNIGSTLLAHVRAREAEVLRKKHLVGAPDLVVEVGSKWTRRRDETLKQTLYERFAVPEYWIVDPAQDAIKVFRLVDERYQRAAELSSEAGDVLATPLLPGLEMPLAEIFAD